MKLLSRSKGSPAAAATATATLVSLPGRLLHSLSSQPIPSVDRAPRLLHLVASHRHSNNNNDDGNDLSFILQSLPTAPRHPHAISSRPLQGTDAVFLSRAVSSCGSDLFQGIQLHCLAVKTGFLINSYVGTCLIRLYCRCGQLFTARKVLDEMSAKNVVSWTVLISGYAQEWQVDACLELYASMRSWGSEPNDLTFLALLSACMGSGAIGQGRSIHCHAFRAGFDLHTHVSNALISMYCKCGDIQDALRVFRNMPLRDIVSWNSMIAGHAQFGQAVQATELFEEMKRMNVEPDRITFLSVLSSCRHAGLLQLGQDIFDSMARHGVEPELSHYSCIIDLLGRSQKLEEARSLIERMPIVPNAVIWGSLLSSCRVHGSVWMGIEAAESRLALEPQCAATHVQLANLYASVGYWDEAAMVRKLMKDGGLRTCPGNSWIEISNKVHRFRADDASNNNMVTILSVVNCLIDHMRSLRHPHECYEEEDDGGIQFYYGML